MLSDFWLKFSLYILPEAKCGKIWHLQTPITGDENRLEPSYHPLRLLTNRSGPPVLATLSCRPIRVGRLFLELSQKAVRQNYGGGG